MPERIVNFDDPIERSKVLAWARTAKGAWRMELARFRKRRSDKQNRYLWGCCYPYVAAGLFEAWGEQLNNDEVHEFLKAKFLTKPIINRSTGEQKGVYVSSSAVLSTEQFSEYVEKIAKFAAEDLGVPIPLPNEISEPARARVGA